MLAARPNHHQERRHADSRVGDELERRGNADPMTYQGKNGKQYVALVAPDTLIVYALP